MNNISFKANVNTNLAKIQAARMSDKFFVEKVNGQNLDAVIHKVASLASMKENSRVRINPRLDNNMLNLICTVGDDKSIVETTINERSARRLAKDSNFSFVMGKDNESFGFWVELISEDGKSYLNIYKDLSLNVSSGATISEELDFSLRPDEE